MRRYWRALSNAYLPTDRYFPVSVADPSFKKSGSGIGGRIHRAWQRKVAYPRRIHMGTNGALVHILDHSWADMLRHCPKQCPKVVTLHDLIPLHSPEDLSPGQRERFRRRVLNLWDADAIISVSEYSKREAVELLGIPSSMIYVVPNGVESDEFKCSTAKHSQSDGHFRIGSIGSVLLRKNLGIFPDALKALQTRISRPVILERLGQPLPDDMARSVREVLGEAGLIELGSVTDDEVGSFYARQDVIAVPSLYEGFGLPLLEGMAAGVPVVSSSSSSLPEVGGEHVLYFDPRDPEDFASQLARVADDGLPPDWIPAAVKRAESFTWRKTLEKIYDVYDLLL